MKRLIFYIAFGALLLAGCQHDRDGIKEFKTHSVSEERCYKIKCEADLYPWGDSYSQQNRFNVAWPDKGTMTKEAMDELLLIYFGDSTTTDFDKAADKWLKSTYYFDEVDLNNMVPIDSIDASTEWYSYSYLESSCRQDSNLATFLTKRETYNVGGAHGYYTAEYLIVDVEKGSIVHLSDLLDTNLLGEAIAHAVQDLDVNKDVRDCLYDEYIGADRIPITQNFEIDSTRSTITLVYQPYEIACYACGIQSVVLPIFWLSKHTPLTPYAKELFGEGSSL